MTDEPKTSLTSSGMAGPDPFQSIGTIAARLATHQTIKRMRKGMESRMPDSRARDLLIDAFVVAKSEGISLKDIVALVAEYP